MVAVVVLRNDHGRPDHALNIVVVNRYIKMLQKGKELVLMPLQTLYKPAAVPILVSLCDEISQPEILQHFLV
jgi:hypothetical protein